MLQQPSPIEAGSSSLAPNPHTRAVVSAPGGIQIPALIIISYVPWDNFMTWVFCMRIKWRPCYLLHGAGVADPAGILLRLHIHLCHILMGWRESPNNIIDRIQRRCNHLINFNWHFKFRVSTVLIGRKRFMKSKCSFIQKTHSESLKVRLTPLASHPPFQP